MSMEKAVQQVLTEANAKYPEVQSIEIGTQKPAVNCYIIINPDDEEYADAGNCLMKPITQTVYIGVLKKIEINQDEKTVKAEVESTAKKVADVLHLNPLLISSLHPSGFLISGSIIKKQKDKDMHGESKVVFADIFFQGKYFQEVEVEQ
jgi:hypothetical protein